MGDEEFSDTGKEVEELDPKTEKYVQELLHEKHSTIPASHACRLLQEEIDRTLESGRPKFDTRYLDVFHERPTKIVARVSVPTREHPRFNFVGKLLGPKGNTLKALQEETQCKMSVLGRGSIKDRSKEEELRQSGDLKYSHLSDILHVEVAALAPPAEAYARVAYALAEIRKYLIPDSNDDIALQQREMESFYSQMPPRDEEPYQGDSFKRRESGGGMNGPPSFGHSRGGGGRGMDHGAPRGVSRGGRGSRGGPRGGAGGGASYGVPYGGGDYERPAPPQRGRGGGDRGRGGLRGRGGGAPRRPEPESYYEDNGSYNRRESQGGNTGRGYSSGGNGDDSFDDDFQRRSNFTDSNYAREGYRYYTPGYYYVPR